MAKGKNNKRLAAYLCNMLLLSAQTVPAVRAEGRPGTSNSAVSNSIGNNLDLSSTQQSIVSRASGSIKVGGALGANGLVAGASDYSIVKGQLLTPAESIALAQTLNGGQRILLGVLGSAIGGSVLVSSGRHGSTVPALGVNSLLSSIVVPKGVTLGTVGFNIHNPMSVEGASSILGSMYTMQNSRGLTSVLNFADSLNIGIGGLLSTAVPFSFNFTGLYSSRNLNLNVANNLTNHGSISVPGTLNLNVGGVLNNNSLLGAQMANISALNLNIASGSGCIVNSGLMNALGSINFGTRSPLTDLKVSNTGGVIKALDSINLRDTGYSGSGGIAVSGGDWLSKELNFNGGGGTIGAFVENISGKVNMQAACAHLYTAAAPDLHLGNINITGDPTYWNAGGDVTIGGDISFATADIGIIASRDIYTNAAGSWSINANASGSGSGSVTLIAGANITSGGSGSGDTSTIVTYNGASSTGGNIILEDGYTDSFGNTSSGNVSLISTSTSGANAGNVTLIAFGTASGGGAIVANSTSIQANSDGANKNGNVLAIAGDQGIEAKGVQLGSISNIGGTALGSGKLTIANSSVNDAGGGSLTNGELSGSFDPGTLQSSGVTAGSVHSSSDISLISGGGTVQSPSLQSDAGTISVSAGTGLLIANSLVADGDIVLTANKNAASEIRVPLGGSIASKNGTIILDSFNITNNGTLIASPGTGDRVILQNKGGNSISLSGSGTLNGSGAGTTGRISTTGTLILAAGLKQSISNGNSFSISSTKLAVAASGVVFEGSGDLLLQTGSITISAGQFRKNGGVLRVGAGDYTSVELISDVEADFTGNVTGLRVNAPMVSFNGGSPNFLNTNPGKTTIAIANADDVQINYPFVSKAELVVGAVNGIAGITCDGNLSIARTDSGISKLTIEAPISFANNDISSIFVSAKTIEINAQITGVTGQCSASFYADEITNESGVGVIARWQIVFQPFELQRPIAVNGVADGQLSLSPNLLSNLTTRVLMIGDFASSILCCQNGGINLLAPLNTGSSIAGSQPGAYNLEFITSAYFNQNGNAINLGPNSMLVEHSLNGFFPSVTLGTISGGSIQVRGGQTTLNGVIDTSNLHISANNFTKIVIGGPVSIKSSGSVTLFADAIIADPNASSASLSISASKFIGITIDHVLSDPMMDLRLPGNKGGDLNLSAPTVVLPAVPIFTDGEISVSTNSAVVFRDSVSAGGNVVRFPFDGTSGLTISSGDLIRILAAKTIVFGSVTTNGPIVVNLDSQFDVNFDLAFISSPGSVTNSFTNQGTMNLQNKSLLVSVGGEVQLGATYGAADVTLSGNNLVVSTPLSANSVEIAPSNPSSSIGVNGGTGTFQISSETLALISTNRLIIGNSLISGAINLNSKAAFVASYDLSILGSASSLSNIFVNNSSIILGNHELTVSVGGALDAGIISGANTRVSLTGSSIALTGALVLGGLSSSHLSATGVSGAGSITGTGQITSSSITIKSSNDFIGSGSTSQEALALATKSSSITAFAKGGVNISNSGNLEFNASSLSDNVVLSNIGSVTIKNGAGQNFAGGSFSIITKTSSNGDGRILIDSDIAATSRINLQTSSSKGAANIGIQNVGFGGVLSASAISIVLADQSTGTPVGIGLRSSPILFQTLNLELNVSGNKPIDSFVSNFGNVTVNAATSNGAVTVTSTGDVTLGSVATGTLALSSSGKIELSNIASSSDLILNASAVNLGLGLKVNAANISITGLSSSALNLNNHGSFIADKLLNIAAAPGRDLFISGVNGVIQSKSSAVLISAANLGDSGNKIVFSSNQTLLSKTLISAGGINQSVVIEPGIAITAPGSTYIHTNKFVNQGSIGPGDVILSAQGAGTIQNPGGSIDLKNFGNLKFQGQSLAILASGDIVNTGAAKTVDLSFSGIPGGALSIIAGFKFVPTNVKTGASPVLGAFTLTGATGIPSKISLANVSINTGGAGIGGTVRAIATGGIVLGSINTSASIEGGSVSIIGNGVSVGSIDTNAAASGALSIQSGIPQIVGNIEILDGVMGSGGAFIVASKSGQIATGTINAGSNGSVSLSTAGPNGTVQTGAITSGLLSLSAGIGNLNLKVDTYELSISSPGNVSVTNNRLGRLSDSTVGGSFKLSVPPGVEIINSTIASGKDFSIDASKGSISISGSAINSLSGAISLNAGTTLGNVVVNDGSILMANASISINSAGNTVIGKEGGSLTNLSAGSSVTVKSSANSGFVELGAKSFLMAGTSVVISASANSASVMLSGSLNAGTTAKISAPQSVIIGSGNPVSIYVGGDLIISTSANAGNGVSIGTASQPFADYIYSAGTLNISSPTGISFGQNVGIGSEKSLSISSPASVLFGNSNYVSSKSNITLQGVGNLNLGTGSEFVAGGSFVATANAGKLETSLTVGGQSSIQSNLNLTLSALGNSSKLIMGDSSELKSGITTALGGFLNLSSGGSIAIGSNSSIEANGNDLKIVANSGNLSIASKNQFAANGGNVLLFSKFDVIGSFGNTFHATAKGSVAEASKSSGGGIEIGSGLSSSPNLLKALSMKNVGSGINPEPGMLGSGVVYGVANNHGGVIQANKTGSGIINLNSSSKAPSILLLNKGAQVFDAKGATNVLFDKASFQTDAFKPIAMVTTVVERDGTEQAEKSAKDSETWKFESGGSSARFRVLHNEGKILMVEQALGSASSSKTRSADLEIYARSFTKLHQSGTGAIFLEHGEVFLDSSTNIRIRTRLIDLSLQRGALVSIEESDSGTCVRSCGAAGAVNCAVDGKLLTLYPGEELFVSPAVEGNLGANKPTNASLGRRHQRTAVQGKKQITIHDFAIVTLLANSAVMTHMLRCENGKHQLARILKTAAAIDLTLKNRGAYTVKN